MSDENKQGILDTLNHFRTTARSINSIPVGVRDIQAYAKENFELKQPEVAVALDYLIQHGWVEQIREERTFTRGQTTIPTTQSKYKLSAQGIALFDGDSRYNALNRFSGINIENVGGVVVVGNNNVVNNKYKELYTQLDALEGKLKLSDQLTERQKLDASAEIQTIKDQLSKDSPNPSIVAMAMEAVGVAANLAGAADFLDKAQHLVRALF